MYDREGQAAYTTEFDWTADAPSKFTIVNKNTAQVEAVIETEAFFTAHQVSDVTSYEDVIKLCTLQVVMFVNCS